jgi:hypothetical protein
VLLLCCALQLCEMLSLVLLHYEKPTWWCKWTQTICSLLQVSTAVRRTVQSSRALCSIDLGMYY